MVVAAAFMAAALGLPGASSQSKGMETRVWVWSGGVSIPGGSSGGFLLGSEQRESFCGGGGVVVGSESNELISRERERERVMREREQDTSTTPTSSTLLPFPSKLSLPLSLGFEPLLKTYLLKQIGMVGVSV